MGLQAASYRQVIGYKPQEVTMGYIDDQKQKAILSDNLNYYIAISGKDQKQIAIELDINPPTLNQWVNGKAIPSVSMLKKLAEYFGVVLSDLVDVKWDDPEELELTAHEKKLIKAYKMADIGIRNSVDILLNVKKED